MTTTFNFDVTADTPNGKANPMGIKQTIVDHAQMLHAIDGDPYVTGGTLESGGVYDGGTLTVEFKDDLTANEETVLTNIVAAHVGQPSGNQPTVYQYPVATAFPGGKFNRNTFERDILASDIGVALQSVTAVAGVNEGAGVYAGGTAEVTMNNPLGPSDLFILQGDWAGGAAAAGGLIGSHDSAPTPRNAAPVEISGADFNQFGQLSTAAAIGVGGGFRFVSHNYCDPCTWWQGSTEQVDQPAADEGAQTVYDITGHAKIIDLRHDRVTFEDEIDSTTVSPAGVTMTNILPEVKVNGVALPYDREDHPDHADRYTIDYDDGKITFAVARAPADVVTVSFRKAASSVFCIKPKPDLKLVMIDAEVDFSEDVDMVSKFFTLLYGSHSQLTAGFVVNIGGRVYKSMRDFHAAARRFYGPLPGGLGGSGGIPVPKWTFEWQYSRSDVFYATPNYRDQNGEPEEVTWNYVELGLIGDIPYNGSYLTITYYGHEVKEANGA